MDNKKHRILFLNEEFYKPLSDINEYYHQVGYKLSDYFDDLQLLESGHELSKYDAFIENELIGNILKNKIFVSKAKRTVSMGQQILGVYSGYVYDYNDDSFIKDNEPSSSQNTRIGLYISITNGRYGFGTSYAAMVERIKTTNGRDAIQLFIADSSIRDTSYLLGVLKHEFVHVRQSFAKSHGEVNAIPEWNPLHSIKNMTYQHVIHPDYINGRLHSQIQKMMQTVSKAENYAYITQCIHFVKTLGIDVLVDLYHQNDNNVADTINSLIETFRQDHFKSLNLLPSIFDKSNINTSDDFIKSIMVAVYIDLCVHRFKRMQFFRENTDLLIDIMERSSKTKTINDMWRFELLFHDVYHWCRTYRNVVMNKLRTGIYIALDNLGFFDEIKNNEYNEQT